MNQNTQGGNPTISPDLARRLQENFRGTPADRETAAQDRPPQQAERAPAAAPQGPATSAELARAVRELLRAHLSQLEAGLTPTDQALELDGMAGQPSILARTGAGGHVIVEFSPEDASMEVLTQTLCFMGALQERVQQPVRGILVAKSFPQSVRFAARMVPGMQLKTYSFAFTFGDGAARS